MKLLIIIGDRGSGCFFKNFFKSKSTNSNTRSSRLSLGKYFTFNNLIMFSLGVRMNTVDFSDWKIGVPGTVMSPITGLAIAIPVGLLLGIAGVDRQQLIIFGALPPAVLNFLFAEKYGQEPRQVAAMVLMGNMSAVIVIPAVLYFVL